ncbi:putative phage tail protein [Clostridium magnum]|uniref:DUF2313 domain-containing protein n=1 Tax=Clostridium magnum DSM 2767 TaxID=1121326 RepID=A0A162UX88_9CLOT|nr:putative phage tail protein [Clostridium magnum]KZL94377.1 hypothetical protein CLMAG_14300 [Clostridium magnum DSM 2767]SHJ50297.1 hypothetical protein SAMN02745944_06072 [Clostridium magnum DSM 2767]
MDLKSYLPPFLFDSNIFTDLFIQYQAETDNLESDTQDLLNQLFPNTATWGLVLWEQLVGITTNTSINIEVRRVNVLNKLSQIYTMTASNMTDILKKFTDGLVSLIQNYSMYTFDIDFNVKSKAVSLLDLLQTIETIKPAHLDYSLSINLNPTAKGVYNAVCHVSGESISLYPYIATNIDVTPSVELGMYFHNIETSTLYPKEE